MIYFYTPIRAGVAEWQTHQTQNLAMATSCGFKSHLRHQIKIRVTAGNCSYADFFAFLRKRFLTCCLVSQDLFTFYSMFVNHFVHKGPRPIARPLLMAAFYEFKAAVSDFYSAAKSSARRPACLKFSDAATRRSGRWRGGLRRLAALRGQYRL